MKEPRQEITIPLSFDVEYLLVKFRDNFADEIDMHGFRTFTTEDWEAWKNNLPKNRIRIGLGNIGDMEYDSREKFLNRCFKITVLTVEQAKALFDLFGRKDMHFLDWNDGGYDKIIHSTIATHGFFPFHLGEKENQEEDDEDDPLW